MLKIILHNIAEDAVRTLFKRDKRTFEKIKKALDELELKGIKASDVKKLTNTKNIYRKRTGRWRILFTQSGKVLDVWIVAVEKDSQKDYNRWIQYITYQVE